MLEQDGIWSHSGSKKTKAGDSDEGECSECDREEHKGFGPVADPVAHLFGKLLGQDDVGFNKTVGKKLVGVSDSPCPDALRVWVTLDEGGIGLHPVRQRWGNEP